MDLNSEQLTAAALQLPSAERARVAEALIASLDLEGMRWDAEWLAEADGLGAAQGTADRGRRSRSIATRNAAKWAEVQDPFPPAAGWRY